MLVGVALVAVIVALAVYRPSLAAHIQLTIDGPHEITAGTPTTLSITVTNNNDVPLVDVHWQPLLSQNAFLADPSIGGDLPSIAAHGSVTFPVHLVQFDDGATPLPRQVIHRIHISFRGANTQTNESLAQAWQPTITKNAFTLSVNAPKKILAGQDIAYDATITNQTGYVPALEINDVSSTPSGVITPTQSGSFALIATLVVTHADEKFIAARDEKTVQVVAGPVTISFTAADVLRVHMPLIGSLTVTNTTDAVVRLDRIEIPLPQRVFGSVRPISIPAQTAPQINAIAPHASVTLPLTIPAPRTITIVTLNNAHAITVQPSVTGFIPDFQTQTWHTAALSVPVATQLTLATHVAYTNEFGDQLGRGPWPPRADKETKVWVFVTLATTIHAVRDGVVTFLLPDYVIATDKRTTTGNAEISTDTHTVTAVVHELDPNDPLTIGFEIALTPTADQPINALHALREITVHATDAVSDATLTQHTSAQALVP